jgi:Ca-activated chloride channel family protein
MTGLVLTLLRPGWLLALPVLAAVGWWLWRRAGVAGDWARAADPALLRALAALGRVEPQGSRLPMLAALAASGLLVLALSGPAVERRDAVSYRNLDGAVFVLDASPAHVGGPLWPQVVAAGRFAIAGLGARPAGLVLYAGDAYVATDMTSDLLQLGQTLSLVTSETVPDPGTRPARGLALAVRMLAEAQVIAGDVVLVTDGGGLGPDALREAAAIAARGARLAVVAPGPPDPGMAALAQVGGGRVFALTEAAALSDWLSEGARTRLERQDFALLFWHDLGRYLLIPALAALLILFRRAPI